MLGTNIEMTFTQCCLNIASMLANVNQCSDNAVALSGFWSEYNVGTILNIHAALSGHPHNVAGMFNSIYK